jgi:hypothetical protein
LQKKSREQKRELEDVNKRLDSLVGRNPKPEAKNKNVPKPAAPAKKASP